MDRCIGLPPPAISHATIGKECFASEHLDTERRVVSNFQGRYGIRFIPLITVGILLLPIALDPSEYAMSTHMHKGEQEEEEAGETYIPFLPKTSALTSLSHVLHLLSIHFSSFFIA